MRKFFKFLVGVASAAALAGGIYYFVKKFYAKDYFDDDYDGFDDFDDFDDSDFDEDEDEVEVNMNKDVNTEAATETD